jgi:hypothetical protein
MPPKIIVQTIYTTWTKASRGHPGSSARNATPESLPLSRSVAQLAGPIVWHDVEFREADGFVLHETDRGDIAVPTRFQWIDVTADLDDALVVSLFGEKRFVLRGQESGSVLYNLAEDVPTDGWRSTLYHKICFYISVDVPFDPGLFLRPATHTIRSLRNLS